MVSNVDYLLSLVGNRNDIIRDTWVLQGTMIASKMTRRYIKDNIFQVSCSEGKPLNGALIYCLTDYEVDNDVWPCIDWDEYEIEDMIRDIAKFNRNGQPYLHDPDKMDDVLSGIEQAKKEMDELVAQCEVISANKDREIENAVEELKSEAYKKMPQVVELIKKNIE